MGTLAGKTLFITGASRGIGLAIALRAARDGANIVIAAKTDQPHKRLPGTIHTAAAAVESAGGRALPLVVDVRDEASVRQAVERAVAHFGGIDICVNNASAISLTGTADTRMVRYDLMHQVNARGTFLTSKLCLEQLRRASNPHILTLAPPLDLSPKWFAPHVAYTVAKYGMSLYMLGMAAEFRRDGIACNALWPRTTIATAAVEFAVGDAAMLRACRKPDIMADAAHAILCSASRELTGQFLIDDSYLYSQGVRDFEPYRVAPPTPLMRDFFVPHDAVPPPGIEATLAPAQPFRVQGP